MAHCKANQLDMHGFCNRFDAPCIKKNCRFFGVETNADRIRAMSDEELAVFVRAIIRAEYCPATGCDCNKCFFKEPCFNGSKWHGKETEWLKQPADMRGEEDGK